MCALTGLLANASPGQAASFDDQFARAVETKGSSYVAARDAIIAKKSRALSFLRGKLSAPDWHAQVLAAAMISRITDPDLYTHYERLTIVPVVRLRNMNTHLGGGVGLRVDPSEEFLRRDWVTGPVNDRAYFYGLDNLRRDFADSGVPFLTELALKGSILTKPAPKTDLPEDKPDKLYTKEEAAQILNVSMKLLDGWMDGSTITKTLVRQSPRHVEVMISHIELQGFIRRYMEPWRDPDLDYGELARCWAAIQLRAFTDDTRAMNALTELLRSRSEPATVRRSAAWALGASRDKNAVAPLTSAQTDTDASVAARAKEALEILNADLAAGKPRPK